MNKMVSNYSEQKNTADQQDLAIESVSNDNFNKNDYSQLNTAKQQNIDIQDQDHEIPVTKTSSGKTTIFISLCQALDMFKIDILPLYYNHKNQFSTKVGTLVSLIFMIGSLIFISLMVDNYWSSGDYFNYGDDDPDKLYYFDHLVYKQRTLESDKPNLNDKIDGEEEILAIVTPFSSFKFGFIAYKVETQTYNGQTFDANSYYYGDDIKKTLFEENKWYFSFYKNDQKLGEIETNIDCVSDKQFIDYALIKANLFGLEDLTGIDICQFQLSNLDGLKYWDGKGNEISKDELQQLIEPGLGLKDSYTLSIVPQTLTHNSDDYNIQMLFWSDFFNEQTKSFDFRLLYQTIELLAGQESQYTFYYQLLIQEFITGWFSTIHFYRAWFEIFDFSNPTLSNPEIRRDATDAEISFKFVHSKQLVIEEFSKNNIAVTLSTILSVVLSVKTAFSALMRIYTFNKYEQYARSKNLQQNLQLDVLAETVKKVVAQELERQKQENVVERKQK